MEGLHASYSTVMAALMQEVQDAVERMVSTRRYFAGADLLITLGHLQTIHDTSADDARRGEALGWMHGKYEIALGRGENFLVAAVRDELDSLLG